MAFGLVSAYFFGPNDKVSDPDFDKECIELYVEAERKGDHANKVNIYLDCVDGLEEK